MSSHYDKDYFDWQKNIGAFGGWANLTKFEQFISTTDNVLDFGCGGGFLLGNIECAEKMGVELNDTARENAKQLGINVVKNIDDAPDSWADVIISNNALEHVFAPYDILVKLLPKMKKGGKIVFVVPCESFKNKYHPGDVNQHLYSWTPMLLGNLFATAGYQVISVAPYRHKWPKHYRWIAKTFGRRGFEFFCKVYGWYKRDLVQIRIIATRN